MNRPETDGSYKDTALYDDLNAIAGSIRAVSLYLHRVEAAMATLEQAGMYPAPSTERWRAERNCKLLYMYFPEAATMPHLFRDLKLDSKRRLYIGADPARIAEAQRLAENTRRWRALQVYQQNCFGWLRRHRNEVADLARRASKTPNLDEATLDLYAPVLGTDVAGAIDGHGPNEAVIR